MKKFYINRKNAYFFGVCSGISDYTGIDVLLIRILVFLLCVYSSLAFILYFIAALTSPTK